MGIFKGNGIYKNGSDGGSGVGWDDVSNDNEYIGSVNGINGSIQCLYNKNTKELQVNVFSRKLSYSGNADQIVVVLGPKIKFKGLQIGMAWSNNNDRQYNAANLGIVKNEKISGSRSDNTLYMTMNTTGSYYTLCIRCIVDEV